jgi:hypothetical protein
MAIVIVQNLEASPNPTRLPKRVEFRQTLRSTRREGEAIELVYTLAAQIPIYFVDSDGTQVKQISRDENVGPTDQVCVDRITLAQVPGSTAMASVQIDQAIQDAAGLVLTDSCVLSLI